MRIRQEILLGVGGSATTDGGIGAASALGWKFLSSSGNLVPPTGAGLDRIATIEKPPNLKLPPVDVLCDVDNPLCGEHGAAEIVFLVGCFSMVAVTLNAFDAGVPGREET